MGMNEGWVDDIVVRTVDLKDKVELNMGVDEISKEAEERKQRKEINEELQRRWQEKWQRKLKMT